VNEFKGTIVETKISMVIYNKDLDQLLILDNFSNPLSIKALTLPHTFN
jgi:hypothetical protein